MYANDLFVKPEEVKEDIRIATLNEIAVMKLDAISYGGRKKDFWDLHYLLFDLKINLKDIIKSHEQRFTYTHEPDDIFRQLVNFSRADNDPDPRCLLGKDWDTIKLDIIEATMASPRSSDS